MSHIICPFCLKPHDFDKSLECTEYSNQDSRMYEVPNAYVTQYEEIPPMWLVTVGFSGHGKTTYLAALTLMLEHLKEVFYLPLDQFTFGKIREMRREAEFGELPESNAVEEPIRPLLINVQNLPEMGSRCLVMYDVAGEIYNSLDDLPRKVPSIKQVNTTWFLVSLADLADRSGDDLDRGRSITDLFYVYLQGMRSLHADLQGRNLIVVYTKADIGKFSPEIKSYLRSDPFQSLTRSDRSSEAVDFVIDDYMRGMQDMSSVLEEYTRKHVKNGSAFISMVKASGMNLVFSVTSALGQSAENNRLRENAIRYRVLDPFFWALKLETSSKSRELALIIDASTTGDVLYTDDLLPEVWKEFSKYGLLTTYYLGQSESISHPGQTPPKSIPEDKRVRLIGPILDGLSSDTQVVVMTVGGIYDLSDFSNSSWAEKIHLISFEDDYSQGWTNSIVFDPNDNPVSMVKRIMRTQ